MMALPCPDCGASVAKLRFQSFFSTGPKELTTITKMVAHFGVDRILKIHNEIGIVNFGKRSIDSLEKLEKIIDNDEDALREIRDKEIIVRWQTAFAT